MIFETLNESNNRAGLLLAKGGMCHFHYRRDGQITIREIIVDVFCQRAGIGRRMLAEIIAGHPEATSVFAKCPADLPANGWYAHIGFQLEGTETTRSGRQVNLWRLPLPLPFED